MRRFVERCTRWKKRRENLDAKEKRLRFLADEVKKNVPPISAALYEPVRIRGTLQASPYWAGVEARAPWTKKRLESILAGHRLMVPTEDGKARVLGLMGLIDEHSAAKDRAWAEYKRLDRKWQRLLSKNDRLLTSIAEAEAQALPGIAAQIEALQADGQFSQMHANSEHIERIMSNLLRLVAALPAEA